MNKKSDSTVAPHCAILLLRKIPKGKVVTYKELARASDTSPRAAGRIMSKNTDPVGYPCYKVVSSAGKMCGYSAPGGTDKKISLLKNDGVMFRETVVDSASFYRFTDDDISAVKQSR